MQKNDGKALDTETQTATTIPAMKEHKELPSLEALGEGIERVRGKARQTSAGAPGRAAGVQSGIELVSGALVGGVSGYFLDKWLNTSPILFIVCFFLGCAGGFMTLYRSAKLEDHDYPTTTAKDTQDDK